MIIIMHEYAKYTIRSIRPSPSRSRERQLESVTVDEEESEFPRGGQETLTPLEKRLIKQQAQQDVLFGEVSLNMVHLLKTLTVFVLI